MTEDLCQAANAELRAHCKCFKVVSFYLEKGHRKKTEGLCLLHMGKESQPS